jgi:hypothetical protein
MAMQVVRVEVEGQVLWKCLRAKGGNYVAVCDPLGLTVQSPTWGELMEDINSTLDAMLRDLLETNDLDRFLRSHGWQISGPLPMRPAEVRFDLPFIPQLVDANGSQRVLRQ